MTDSKWFLGLMLLLATAAVAASDLDKEQRWADQVVDNLFDGEVEWLQADGHEFLAIYTEAEDTDSNKAVVVLHGIGVHPDWPQVVYPLRTRLPADGWNSLSIQLPVLPNDAKEVEYAALMGEVAPRLDAALAFLRERGMERVVLVGHSLGSVMAVYYLSSAERDVQGLVAVGLGAGIEGSQYLSLAMLGSVHQPMLDLYGSDDTKEVLEAASQRHKRMAGVPESRYRSRQVTGANHFFDGREDALVAQVTAWLNGLAP